LKFKVAEDTCTEVWECADLGITDTQDSRTTPSLIPVAVIVELGINQSLWRKIGRYLLNPVFSPTPVTFATQVQVAEKVQPLNASILLILLVLVLLSQIARRRIVIRLLLPSGEKHVKKILRRLEIRLGLASISRRVPCQSSPRLPISLYLPPLIRVVLPLLLQPLPIASHRTLQ
jgi:hypothetical protein